MLYKLLVVFKKKIVSHPKNRREKNCCDCARNNYSFYNTEQYLFDLN